MRVLRFHATEFNYNPNKKTPLGVEVDNRKTKFENVLVLFTSFEKKDEGRIPKIIEEYKRDIKEDVERLGTRKILIYPYAHLSKNLGDPKKAQEFFTSLIKNLKEFNVHLAPFGWYKEVKTEIKGHPLAESYREY